MLTYDLKDYVFNPEFKPVCEKHAKYAQEIMIVERIMVTLNKGIDLDAFMKQNESLNDFFSNDRIAKHVNTFGNPINEEDYKQILERLKTIKKQKESFKTDEIKTSIIDGKEKTEEYNSLKNSDGNHLYFDNSNSNKTILERMSDIQKNSKDSQTTDTEKNTKNTFNALKESQKDISFNYLNQINYFDLSQKERDLYDKALYYQIQKLEKIKVNLEKGLIALEDGSVIKIEESGKILEEENGMQLEAGNKKTYQKTFTRDVA